MHFCRKEIEWTQIRKKKHWLRNFFSVRVFALVDAPVPNFGGINHSLILRPI